MSPGPRRRSRGTPAGFSLAELVVALLTFEVGILGVLGLGMLAAREVARAADVQRAVGVTEVVVDSLLRAAEPAGDGEVEVGVHTVRWSEAPGGMRVETRRTGSPGAALVTFELPLEP